LRGVAGKDLSPEIMEFLGRAYGTYLKRHQINEALVGHDSRATSQEYSEALIKGFNWAGINTTNIGLALVGTFYWAQYFLNKKGGAFITASHNPAEYNGLKLAIDFSETLVHEGMQEIRKMMENDDFEKGEKEGIAENVDIKEAYIKDLNKRIKIDKKFKVVIDPSCTTAGIIVPEVLRSFGLEVVENNCQLDSSFPLGTPDPTEISVAQRVKEKVLATGADIGFSYDADGDRIGIVDEKGNIIWNDVLIAIFAIDILGRYPGSKIMFNILSSKVVEDTVRSHGGQSFMWRVGHSFLKKKNQEVKAPFIGELSGHFFFSADFYNHDDGCYTTLKLLEYLSRSNQTLSQAVAALPQYISSPEIKVGCPDDKKTSLIRRMSEALKQDYSEAEIIDDERAGDGVRLELPDSMLVVRYSQNGPYITVKFEARERERYDELKNYLNKSLHNYPEIDWSYGVNVESLE